MGAAVSGSMARIGGGCVASCARAGAASTRSAKVANRIPGLVMAGMLGREGFMNPYAALVALALSIR